MSYKFIKTKDEKNEYDISNIELSTIDNEVTLDLLIQEFESFLLACGFHFKGRLDIVDDDIVDNEGIEG